MKFYRDLSNTTKIRWDTRFRTSFCHHGDADILVKRKVLITGVGVDLAGK